MRVLMSGGGTAGHIYPALAVAEELRAGGRDDVEFVGTPQGLEARLVPGAGLRFIALPARGFDRSRPVSLVVALALIAVSAARAFAHVLRTRPDVVVGFGGYVSIPVGLAAVCARRPLVLHEQNSVPGLANRMLARWARRVCVTYESSAHRFARPDRVVLTGNPVRPVVLEADPVVGRERLGVPADALMLLVFGGSRGARHINNVISAARDALLGIPGLHVVHVAGPAERASVEAAVGGNDGRYQVLDYIDDMGSALSAADLVVARAGATSIAEITALGRPSVLVPYPFATDDHQTTNAQDIERAGGAVLFADSDIDDPSFVRTVTDLLSDAERRATMAAAAAGLGRRDAARRVVDVVRAAAAHTHQEEVL